MAPFNMTATITASTATELLAVRWPYIITTIVALAIVWFLWAISRQHHLSKIPIAASDVGGEEERRLAYIQNAKRIYQDAYQKFKGGVFRVSTTSSEQAVGTSVVALLNCP